MEFHQPSGGIGCPSCGQRIFSTRGVCHRCCDHVDAYLARTIKANGTTDVSRRCSRCREWLGGIKNSDVLDLEALPVHRDHRGSNPPCEHCGHPDSELHHYAPQALFDDPDSWATGYLCPRCHQHWHRTMNAAARRKSA